MWIVHETFTESTLYGEKGYTINAPFEDLKQLKTGSDVRLAGVSIGSVKATKLRNETAIAVLTIAEGIPVPSDSVATITTAGLLGNNYVAIEPGKAKTLLKEGDTIKTRRTRDINEVVGEIGNISDKITEFLDAFTGEGKGEMKNLFTNLNDLIEDNKNNLTKTFANLEEITTRLVDGEGTLGKLMTEDKAYDDLLAMVDDIKKAAEKTSDFMDEAKDITHQVKGSKGALGVLLYDEKAADQLKNTIANFDEFSEKLNSNDSTLGRLVTDDSLYVKAENAMDKVENAVEAVENSGPITATGVVAGALF